MPKIVVNEKDLSWYYRNRRAGEVTVYMPGIATSGPEEPVLVTSENFNQVFGAGPVAGLTKDTSYQTAASLVSSGFNVLFHRVIPYGATAAGSTTAEVKIHNNTENAVVDLVVGDINGITIEAGADWSHTFDTIEECFKFSDDIKELYPEFCTPSEEGVESVLTVVENCVAASGVVTGPDRGYVVISALDKGTRGNSISVRSRGTGNVRRLTVRIGEGPVEELTVDFKNVESQYYYTHVDSAYISIELHGEFDTSSMVGEVKLSGGHNYQSGWGEEEVLTNVREAMVDNTGFFEDLVDPYLYTFNAIVDGGLNSYDESDLVGEVQIEKWKTPDGDLESYPSIVEKAAINLVKSGVSKLDLYLVGLAAARGTAIYFVDGKSDWDKDEYYDYCDKFNTSYAAAFGPWGTCSYTSNGVRATLPGSYQMLVTWAQSVAVGNPVWAAPAGVKRAQVNVLKNPNYQIGATILDQWQNHEYVANQGLEQRINPIMRLKQYGYVIYGNSTLLKENEMGGTSMLQSFNIRVLSNLIKEHAFDVSLSLQFDQMDDNLFVQFKALMGMFMDQLKYQGALYNYKIVLDRSSVTAADLNARTVPVRIMISPNPAAENFLINLEISQAGISFDDDTDETEIA